MKKILAMSVTAVIAASVLHVCTAEGRRFGGGMNFGHFHAIQLTTSQAFSARSSMRGHSHTAPHHGLLGAIAGLAMGGLIGTLLFGGNFQGINLFDILVICGILLLILGMTRRKTDSITYAGQQLSAMYLPHYKFHGQKTNSPTNSTPAIIEENFLDSAKEIFVRMQSSWDTKDMTDIRRFCTPEISSRIQSDIASLGGGRALTEVVKLYAELTETWLESGYEWASVHFKAILREQSLDASGVLSEDISHTVNEFWIFRHDPRIDDPTWLLAGIQQNTD